MVNRSILAYVQQQTLAAPLPRQVRGFPALAALARAKGCSPHALALAFYRHKWPCIVHIPGARTMAHATDAVAGPRAVRLTQREFDALDRLGQKK